MTDELKKLLAKSKDVKLTKEQQEAQRRSFVYGNTGAENKHVTKDLVDQVADEREARAKVG